MDLIRFALMNFGCIGQATVQCDRQGILNVVGVNHDSAAASSNGSGKTTVFKGLTWIFYGQVIDGDRGDAVIRIGKDEVDGLALLKDDRGEVWRINRNRQRGKATTLRIFPPGEDEPLPGDPATLQGRINDLLGLDYHTFRNTVLYGQGDAYRFADPRTKDSQRKDMLYRILRTGVLKRCLDLARTGLKVQHGRIEKVRERVANLKARIEELDPAEAEERAAEWEEQRGDRIESLREMARDQIKAAKRELARVSQRELFQRSLDIVTEEIQVAVDRDTSRLAELAAKVENTEAELNARIGDHASLRAQVDRLEDELDRLSGDRCPTCTSPLDRGAAKKHVTRLRRQVRTTRRDMLTTADTVEEIRGERNRYRAKQIKASSAAHRKMVLMEREQERAVTALEDMEDIEDRINEHRELARKLLADIKVAEAEDNPWLIEVRERRKKRRRYRKQLKTARRKHRGIAERVAHYTYWTRGFSDRGLPSFLLDSVMPFLTERANQYLEVLSDGDIVLAFSTQRELKSKVGRFRDEIEIRWTVEGQEGVTPSGGQQKKIEVATDLALMDLAAQQDGARFNVLILDEVLDGLDAEGRARVIRLLQGLRSERETIFIISHDAESSEAFAGQLVVEKRDGEAEVVAHPAGEWRPV